MTPILSVLVDSVPIKANESINLIVSNITTYKIACSAVNSKPDVDLSIFDTNSLLSLSNGLNNKSYGFCDTKNLCTSVLEIDFQVYDARLYNMTSLTCATTSRNPLVSLSASTQRNISVKARSIISTSFFLLLFILIFYLT